MVYFKMQDLIGNNSVAAYQSYLYYSDWLNNNIPLENWHMDRSCMILINGINIPQGIKFYHFEDAIAFVRSTT